MILIFAGKLNFAIPFETITETVFAAMLWKKESKKKNALYVDISKFKSSDDMEFCLKQMIITTNGKSLPRKNNAISLKRRQEGNELFGKSQWVEAIEKYNGSLCFAEPGSEHISLAYANRSAVFVHMKKYNECLKDIELAKGAGYPARLMSKLDQRQADCLKGIEKGDQAVDVDVKLSYEADKHFPCMANVLQIETGAGGSRKVVANEDIDVGQTIMVEKSFMNCLLNRFESKCSICLKAHVNLVPCNKCTRAIFCSVECQENPLHKMECGMRLCDMEIMNNASMKEFRILLLAINMFASADELMEFVEETRQSDPKDLPSTLVDERSKYRAFLKQKTCVDCFKPGDLASNVYAMYNGLLKVPEVSAKFASLKHKRFLMHLIAFHSFIGCHGACCNTAAIPNMPIGTDAADAFEFMHNVQVGLMATYFTHSFTPNMLSVRGNGIQAGIVVRPIKKGEEVLNSCVPCRYDPTKYKHPATIAELTRFRADSDYRYIAMNFVNSEADPQTMINKCIAVLRKYGQIGWCEQITMIMNVYGKLVRDRLES